jgi:hypothetical protein
VWCDPPSFSDERGVDFVTAEFAAFHQDVNLASFANVAASAS